LSDEAIDQAILSVLSAAGGHWRKVAFVVAAVASSTSVEFPDGDEAYERVGRRIEALASKGRLIAQGNVQNWRHSEVRTPN
jgi:hypothetical protein